MRDAPAYSAERFPGDFAASALCGAVVAVLLRPVAWLFARSYVVRTYPGHVEMLGAAVLMGMLDGLLLAVLAFVACFAVRIWRFERQ